MNFNVDIQSQILDHLSSIYPNDVSQQKDLPLSEHEDIFPNLYYLVEHGLIDADLIKQFRTDDSFLNLKITIKGLDFLRSDGGLTAVFNTVTIKFDPEEIRALLTEKIQQSSLPPDQKNRLLETFQNLPAEGLKRLLLKLFDQAMDHIPSVSQIIEKLSS